MSDKPAKSPGKKPAGAPPEDPASKDAEPGRLEVDDRGNVTWQWTDGGLLADDTLGAAQRMRHWSIRASTCSMTPIRSVR